MNASINIPVARDPPLSRQGGTHGVLGAPIRAAAPSTAMMFISLLR
jgi:hypothetical protein